MTSKDVQVPILCFNDVYRVSQKYNPQPGAPDDSSQSGTSAKHISVSQFGQLLLSEREKWADRKGKEKDGLVLFAGDVFNPSVESSVTRGSHMVPIMNALKVDVACVGNHDFDFGYPHLTKLVKSTTFPWLLSNIIDSNTGRQPEPLHRYIVTERCGVKIGVVGLVEQDWISTIPSWPKNFAYRPMRETALELSQELRDPNGPHKVDIIIALTHCRLPNDIRLANELGAVANDPDIAKAHGVDLIIGGHDHVYAIGKGAKSWEGYSGRQDAPGTSEDRGVYLIKSGTDFRDLSSATLTLSSTAAGSIRRRIISSLTGRHLYVLPSSPKSQAFDDMVQSMLSTVSEALSKPVCFTLAPFDARSEIVRTQESGLGNWIADVLMHAYAESLFEGKANGNGDGGSEKEKGIDGGADAVLICGGTLRGDSQYCPGKVSLADILEILPFEDPVVCIEIDGKGLHDALEAALSKWPAQEGRFPIVAGLAIKWDHAKPPGSRLISIHQVKRPERDEDDVEDADDLVDFKEQEDGTRVVVKQRSLELGDEVRNEQGGRTYRVITREYMAEGYDGFEALKGRNFIVDDENGQIMSSILRSFLLGSSYIFRHKQLEEAAETHLSSRTGRVLSKARAEHQSSPSVSLSSSPQSMRSNKILPSTDSPLSPGPPGLDRSVSATSWGVLRRHVIHHDWNSIRDALHIAKHEHVSSVDVVSGDSLRAQKQASTNQMPGEWNPPPVQASESSASSEPVSVPAKGKDTKSNAQLGGVLLAQERKELSSSSDDLAIVCPLVDGRMLDVSAGKE